MAVLTIRVIPRAKRAGIDGMRGDALVVRLRSAPVDGAANAELIDVIAAALSVAKRSVIIVSGIRAREKRVRVAGIDAETVKARLAARNTG